MPTELWERLRIAIRAAHMTQATLGRACGVTRATVSTWTNPDPNKRAVPSDANLDKMSAALGVTREWLETGRGEPPDDSALPAGRHFNTAQAKLEEVLLSKDPRIKRRFRRRLAFGDIGLEMDYLSPSLAAQIVFCDGSLSTMANRAKLWQLLILKDVDQSMHVRRQHTLILTCSEVTKEARTLAREAERLLIPVMHTPDVHALADALLETD